MRFQAMYSTVNVLLKIIHVTVCGVQNLVASTEDQKESGSKIPESLSYAMHFNQTAVRNAIVQMKKGEFTL